MEKQFLSQLKCLKERFNTEMNLFLCFMNEAWCVFHIYTDCSSSIKTKRANKKSTVSMYFIINALVNYPLACEVHKHTDLCTDALRLWKQSKAFLYQMFCLYLFSSWLWSFQFSHCFESVSLWSHLRTCSVFFFSWISVGKH